MIGPGLGTDEHAGRLVRAVLGSDVPVLVDADAITIVAERLELLRSRTAPTVLTPHAGELARLSGGDRSEIEAGRLDAVREASRLLGHTVLLKGRSTLVAAPDGTVRVNTAATPYLATAGSGDVLAGVGGALLAGGLDVMAAGSAAAFVHGLAGVLASGMPAHPITASDIVGRIPAALSSLGNPEDAS